MKKLSLPVLILFFCVSTFAQAVPQGFDLSNYGVRIEPDKRVMIVLATLEAARTTNDAGESVQVLKTPLSADGEKFRDLLKSDLAALDEKLRQNISAFVIQYKRRNAGKSDAELVAPFISMAYALTPAPELADPVVTSDLPGTLLDVLDFSPLVRDFYRRSTFSANMPDYLKLYQQASDASLRSSTREMVNDVLSYLHTRPQLVFVERVKTETQKSNSKKATLRRTETRERERRFFIVPELLAPAGSTHFLNVKDDYYAVLSPASDIGGSGIRRAYLQFVIDPLVLNNAKEIAGIRDSVKALLDERRKVDPTISPDVYLMISRSLVAAIEARQAQQTLVAVATAQARKRIDAAKTASEKAAIAGALETYKKAAADDVALQLSESYDKGAVLAFYFAEQLQGVEDSGFDIASSMREMLLSFDPAREAGRTQQFADARKRAAAAREERRNNPTSSVPTIADSPVTTKLVEIQQTINANNYAKASADLKLLAKTSPGEPRVFYNLGRVASLEAESIEDGEQQAAKLREAKSSFENVIRIAQKQPVDAALVSLTYVALAKIYEFFDDNAYAMGLYDKAIQLGDVSGGGHREALAAKQRLLKAQ